MGYTQPSECRVRLRPGTNIRQWYNEQRKHSLAQITLLDTVSRLYLLGVVYSIRLDTLTRVIGHAVIYTPKRLQSGKLYNQTRRYIMESVIIASLVFCGLLGILIIVFAFRGFKV